MRIVEGIKVYTLNETASLLGVHYQTVRSYIKDGRLKGQQIGRPILITEKSIKELVTGETETVSRV